MKELLIFGVFLYWLYESSPAVQTAVQPTLNILNAGPGTPVQSISFAQLQNYLNLDVILPDEADAILAAGQGLTPDVNALANGIAKINAWLAAGGTS